MIKLLFDLMFLPIKILFKLFKWVILFLLMILNVDENNMSEELVNRCLEDVNQQSDAKVFDSYIEAQDYLLKTLQEDNEYYMGVIMFIRYDCKTGENGEVTLGECQTRMCVAEAYATRGEV